MVLEMKVQAAKEPCPDATVPVVIVRYVGLVHSPRVLHLVGGLVGQGKVREARAMRQLEYDGKGYAHNEDNYCVVEDDDRNGVVG